MKTHIIQLNKNDDTISVREKMAWSHTGRILLVFPQGERLLESKLELNLIQRQAAETGVKVALLTSNPNTRFFASQIGIPVFKDLRSAQESKWNEGKSSIQRDYARKSAQEIFALRNLAHPRRPGWMEHPITRIISFTIAVLALFALSVFIFPGAEITLHPHIESQSITIPVTAVPGASAVNLSTGTLPVEFRQVVVEGRKDMPATGQVLIPDQFSTGSLRFTNVSDHRIEIPAGSIVTTMGTNPVKFLTMQYWDIHIEPGYSAVISTRALVPGTSGNLPPDSLVVIEGSLGIDATVTNVYATLGGTDAYVPAPTESDLQLLYEDLIEELEQAARYEIEAGLSDGDYLILPSLQQIDIMNKTVTPELNAPGRELTLILRLRYQAQIVTNQMMGELVKPLLDANIEEGYSPLDGTIQFTQVTTPTFGEDGKAHWLMQAERKLQVSVDINQAISMVKGQSISQGQLRLGQFMNLDQAPSINITPAWWHRLPFLPMRIQIIMAD